MVQGMYHFLRQAWKKPDAEVLRERMVEWRNSNAVVRVEKPLRLDRARELGYKAKNGVLVARVRLVRGGHRRTRPNKGRRSKRMHTHKTLKLNYREIAEQKASRKFPNCEAINSYWIGKDGVHYFFEVILADKNSPEIKADPVLGKLAGQSGRAFRGVTSAGRKARGLRNSVKKVPKVRPSLRAHNRTGN
jgi:large subunit ribosomal protein L15e